MDPGFMHTFFLGKEGMHTHQVRFERNYRRWSGWYASTPVTTWRSTRQITSAAGLYGSKCRNNPDLPPLVNW